MSQNKRTIIRTETREIWTVRRRGKSNLTFWCDKCRTQAEWLSLIEMSRLSGITVKEILNLIKAGLIHSLVTAEGQPAACANSLVAALRP